MELHWPHSLSDRRGTHKSLARGAADGVEDQGADYASSGPERIVCEAGSRSRGSHFSAKACNRLAGVVRAE